jgi:5-dehydro-2-deoxygluconokinase
MLLTTNKPFLVLGRAGLDLYADPPGAETEHAERFSAELGGSAANIAVGIVRLGGKAALASAVSNDAVGRFTFNELKHYGVDTHYMRSIDGEARTSLAVVETRPQNTQSVIYRNNAADFHVTRNDIGLIDFAAFGALIVTGTCFAVEPSRAAHFHAMERARGMEMPVIMDIDYRPYSWASMEEACDVYCEAAVLADIIVGNDEELNVLAKDRGLEIAEEFANSSAQIVVYKMGARGSITFTRGHKFETGIFPVRALKPTGAGDAFLASLIMSLAMGETTEGAVRNGSAAAAIVVTRVGCAPAMPTWDELQDFLSNHTRMSDAHPAL